MARTEARAKYRSRLDWNGVRAGLGFEHGFGFAVSLHSDTITCILTLIVQFHLIRIIN